MPLSQSVLAAIARLSSFYEGDRPYDPVNNPGGFRNGGNVPNFVPALQDVGSVASAFATLINDIVAAGSSSARVYQTLAALQADLAQADKTAAQVIGDTDANNGTYLKNGGVGDGSWSRISPSTALAAAKRIVGVRRSITDYDGAPSLVDNGNALSVARAATAIGDVIRLPGKPGDAYPFPGGFNMNDRTIDPDPGVKVTGVGDFTTNGRVLRPLLIQRNQSGSVDQLTLVPDVFKDPAEKALWLSPEQCERTDYEIIDQSKAIYYDVNWAADTGFVPCTPSTTAIDSATFSAPASWRGAMTRIRAGQELGAVFVLGTDASPARAFVIEGSAGNVWLWGGGGGLTLSYKTPGNTRVDGSTPIVWPDYTVDPAWFAVNALWTLRAVSDTVVEAMLNGVVITSIDLSALGCGYILRGGFMTFGQGTGTATIAQMYRARRRFRRGRPSISVLLIGDSITTDSFYGNWPAWLKEWLNGTAGLRVENVDNRAISGETSAQQLARLQSVGVGSATDGVIYIGTNDIQGGLSPAQTANYVGQIIDIMRTAGIVVTLVIPYLWYDKPQTPGGAYGYPTFNGQKGAATRAALIRLGAARGVRVVDLQQVSGRIRSTLADTADSFLRDNIHPSALGSRVVARAIVEGMVSARCEMKLASPLRITPAGWMLNGWTASTANPVCFSIDEGGFFQIGGVLNISSSNRADGVTFLQLPEPFRSLRQYHFPAWIDGNRAAAIIAEPTGLLSIYGAAAGGSAVFFDGPAWPLA